MPRKSPIEQYKDADAEVMRMALMMIIEDPDASNRDRTEAVKALARMHHMLQVDRSTAKVEVKKSDLPKKLSKEINDRLNEILGHREGQGTHTGVVPS